MDVEFLFNYEKTKKNPLMKFVGFSIITISFSNNVVISLLYKAHQNIYEAPKHCYSRFGSFYVYIELLLIKYYVI